MDAGEFLVEGLGEEMEEGFGGGFGGEAGGADVGDAVAVGVGVLGVGVEDEVGAQGIGGAEAGAFADDTGEGTRSARRVRALDAPFGVLGRGRGRSLLRVHARDAVRRRFRSDGRRFAAQGKSPEGTTDTSPGRQPWEPVTSASSP